MKPLIFYESNRKLSDFVEEKQSLIEKQGYKYLVFGYNDKDRYIGFFYKTQHGALKKFFAIGKSSIPRERKMEVILFFDLVNSTIMMDNLPNE